VEEAARIFNQNGFAGASMSELMQATGLEKGGIYRHFSSKEELAAEAFDYAWKLSSEARMSDLESVPNSVDRLKRFISNFVERRPSVPGGCPLLNTAIDADDGNAILRARAAKALRGWRRRITTIITKGLEKKEIKRGVDAEELASLIISSLEGALMMSRLEKKSDPLLAVQRHLDVYLETAVRNSK
jgi:TetR/AcrR family transcriptional repressor of nem operon